MKIKTIIFDLGGVLIDWNPEYVYLKEFNGDRIKMKWFFDNICTPSWNEQQDEGKLMKKATQERVKLFPEYKRLIEMFYGRWEEMLKEEISGTVKILENLKRNNYRLIALTNWSAETFPIAIKKYKFLKLFEGIVVSGEIKMLKPFKEIYDFTLKKYNLDPKECVFIDDKLENIEAAKYLGFRVIHLTNPKTIEVDIKKYLN